MTLSGTKHLGDTGHVSDHNEIELAILTLQAGAGSGASGTPDATSTLKGKHKLTNDLGGTADLPTVVGTHLTAPLPVLQGGTGASSVNWLTVSGTQAASGIYDFTPGTIRGKTPVTSTDLVNKAYADGLLSTTTIDVTHAPYNADKTGVSNASTAIQAAIDACATTGGTVYIPAGTYKINAKIVVKLRVRVRGDGHWSTILRAANGLNDHVVENLVSPDGVAANGEFTVLEDFQIDGNASGLSAGTYYGLHHSMNPLFAWATNDIEYDPHHVVRNVMIYNAKSDGYHADGRSESYLDRVFTFKCGRYGIHPSFDTFLNHCTAAWSGSNGFDVGESSVRGTGNKAFYNGQTTVGGSDGHGFYFYNGQGGINFGLCEAQDNAGAGFALNNCQRSYIQGVADSNSSGHVNATVSAGSYPALDIWSSFDNEIDVVSYERQAYGTSYQQNALQIRQNSTGNKITIKHSATFYNGATIGAAVMTSSNAVWGNDITINMAGPTGNQSVAYAASITPNPYAGYNVVVGALTGNITVNDPATNNRHLGCLMRICFLQDGTGGRTVTWGSGYSPGNWAMNTTANQPCAIEFMWNGTKWQRVSG